MYAYAGQNPLYFIDPLGFRPVEYYLNKWICSSSSWEEAFRKAEGEKRGPFDQNDPMDPDNRTSAEHYIFARLISSGETEGLGSTILAGAYWVSGGYWAYGYQGAKMLGFYPNASPASYAQLYWGSKAYSDMLGLTNAFDKTPGDEACGCKK